MSESPSNSNSDSDSSLTSKEDTNTYSVDDYVDLIKPLLQSSLPIHIDKHVGLRTLVDFSLTHGLFMKNIEKRETKFDDLASFQFFNSSNDKIVSQNLINTLIIRSSNKNQPVQYHAALRNKNVEVCPHLAISLYFFSRFHITDNYGSIEFNGDFIHDSLFYESRLLKGGNRLQSISYSQQHKASSKILKIAGFNDCKNINLKKFLTTSHEHSNTIFSSSSFSTVSTDLNVDENLFTSFNSTDKSVINDSQFDILSQMAGFNGISDYFIDRNNIEPPIELLNQIFPFINDTKQDFLETSRTSPDEAILNRFKAFLRMIRKSLVQDMIIIKMKYPDNIASKHPIFNSKLFNDFHKSIIEQGVIKIASRSTSLSSNASSYINNDFNTKPIKKEEISDTDFKIKQIHQYQCHQDLIIEQLQKQISINNEDYASLNQNFHSFIKQQTEIFQRQSEYLQKIQNTTNGLSILLTSNSKNSNYLINQGLSNNSNTLSYLNNTIIQQGLNNTNELLQKLNYQKQHHHQNFVSITNYSHAYHTPIAFNNSFNIPMLQHELQFQQQNQQLQQQHQPNQDFIIERQQVLSRRLSRQAITIYEMWDDFKSLELDLKNHGISITEWLKVHGSSERQFRHTRSKIITFIENESKKRNVNVEYVKQKLHNKMRNRLRPWTIDEVQRMLTAHKTLQLD